MHWLFVQLSSVSFVVAVVGVYGYLLFLNRNTEHIRVRGKSITICMFLGFALIFEEVVQMGFSEYTLKTADYLASLFFYPCLLTFVMGPFTIKSAVLAFRLQMAAEILKQGSHSVLRSHSQELQSGNSHRRVPSLGNSNTPSQEPGSKPEECWFSEHRYLSSEKFQLVYLLLWAFASLIVPVSTLDHATTAIANTCLFGLSILILIALSFQIRKAQDFWGLKDEMKYGAICGLIGLGIFVGMTVVSSTQFSSVDTIKLAANVVAVFTLSIPILLVPLSKANQERKKGSWNRRKQPSEKPSSHIETAIGNSKVNSNQTTPTGHSRRKRTQSSTGSLHMELENGIEKEFFGQDHWTLVKLLKNPEFEEKFRLHLASEFSLENLLFVKRALDLFDAMWIVSNKSNLDELAEFLEDATEIERDFLIQGASLQLNISQQMREEATAGLQQMRDKFATLNFSSPSGEAEELWDKLSKLYKPAANEIMEMLNLDCFRRFKSTAEFKKFQEKQMHIMVVSSEPPNPPPTAPPQIHT
eukprot:TRINITY_DN3311_c0_g1_i1.p1 TRINITY_DN3311_c0_g1~~TRINITY_DN3311_c0_g1_i1.p1  ORF type:complete len:528 (+),score=127.85 TRINITY_DN3311_c0_g1_i1:1986-3569(+)